MHSSRLFWSSVVANLLAITVMGQKQAGLFDFIIVGGGTAGCTLAGRLCSALPRARILVLEQGKPRSEEDEFLVRASRNFLDSWSAPSISQLIQTEPEPSLNNRSTFGIAANTLGGASSINGGQFTFPKNGTFNSWGFAHLSDAQALKLLGKVKRRLGVGPVASSRTPDYTKEWMAAAAKTGFRVTDNPHDGSADNVVHTTTDAFNDAGRRIDACTGYVGKFGKGKCRHKLVLLQDAKVERVLLKETQKNGPGAGAISAYGVSYRRMGEQFMAKARHEIILSAGPYGSPQILQLSGVGPADVLRRANVPLAHILPVGVYGQGRVLFSVLHGYTAPLLEVNNASVYASPDTRRLFEQGLGGPYAFQSASVNGRIQGVAELTTLFGFGIQPPRTLPYNEAVLASSCLTNPTRGSRTRLWIADSDPSRPPRVRLGALQSREDRRRAAQCIVRMLSVGEELSKLIGGGAISPANISLSDPDLDQKIEEYVANTAMNALHFVGSCAVRRVVNRYFKVYGIERLRVVDSSTIPHIPESVGPLASVYVIANHAANLIISRYSSLLS